MNKIDYKKLSKDKLVDFVTELLSKIRTLEFETKKQSSQTDSLFDDYLKEKRKVNKSREDLEFLGRKLSDQYRKHLVIYGDVEITNQQIIDFIVSDVLKEKKEKQELILRLEKDKVKSINMIDSLKEQLIAITDFKNYEGSDGDRILIPPIDERTTVEEKEDIITKQNKVLHTTVSTDEITSVIGDVELDFLKVIGEMGISLYPEIEQKLMSTGYSTSKVDTAYNNLREKRIITSEQVKTMNRRSGVRIIELSLEVGIPIYKDYFKKNPVISEKQRLIKDHDNLVHGYSIKDVAGVLETLGFREVTIDRKDNTLTFAGGKQFWIPDVIAVDPVTSNKVYFEVEYGTQPMENFEDKLRKANAKANVLRIIVPSSLYKEKLVRRVKAWYENNEGKTNIIITVATFDEMRNKNWGFEFSKTGDQA